MFKGLKHMPEKSFLTWESISAIGVAITGTLGAVMGVIKLNRDTSHKVSEAIEDLNDFKQKVAENYISRPTITAIVNGIEKSMEEKLQRHTAELKLTIREAVEKRNK